MINEQTRRELVARHADLPLISVVTSIHMPMSENTERAQRSHTIGVSIMMKHLVEGEWDLTTDTGGIFMTEFLRRALANAERQGLEIQK